MAQKLGRVGGKMLLALCETKGHLMIITIAVNNHVFVTTAVVVYWASTMWQGLGPSLNSYNNSLYGPALFYR